MRKILKENIYFLIPYALTLLLCIFLLFFYSKTDLHIISNKANSNYADFFFKHITHLGDGAIIPIIFFALFFVKFRYSFAFLTGSLLTAGVINLLKKVILDDIHRPSRYFELFESYPLHYIEGVKLHALQSFPSGHTGTAFNVFFMLALITKNKSLKLCFFILAALVAYSRVYLSQHFMIDITVGSLIGTTIIAVLFLIFEKSNKNWLEGSVLKRYKINANKPT